MATLRSIFRGLRVWKGYSGSCCCAPLSCWRKLKAHHPRKQLAKLYIISFINLFAQSFSIIMLFPFLPFMIQFLVPGVSETAVGRYAGVVGGALFAGRVFGSYLWGIVADKKGRRPVIMWSSILMAVSILAFGFSVNLAMAVITRFLLGLFNGTLTSFKAMISEASDDKFQALGMSVVGAAWSMGFVLGPAVSGAIADPISQYNLTITNSFLHSYLTKFPYSLPCIVNTLLFIVGIIPAAFCLPETLGKKRNRKRSEINQKELELLQKKMGIKKSGQGSSSDIRDQDLAMEDRARLLEDDGTEQDVETALLNDVVTENVGISNPLESLSSDPCESNGDQHRSDNDGSEQDSSAEHSVIEVGGDKPEVNGGVKVQQEKKETKTFKKFAADLLRDLAFFMCHRNTLIPLVLYMVFSFAVIGYNEVFSLWAFTQPHYGGLGFSLHEIGIVLTIASVFQFPMNLFAFAILEKYLKSIKVFYIGAIILTFTVLMLPHLHYLVNGSSRWLMWVLLVFVTFVLNSNASLVFSAIALFINNSVTFDKLGAINGLSMSLTSLTRCVSPILTGLFFSLTLSDATLKIGFPLDYNFVFVMFSVTYLSCVFLVACLPESINYQKIIEDV